MESLNLLEQTLIDGPTNDATNSDNLTGFNSGQGYGLEQSNISQNQLDSNYGVIEEAGNTSLHKLWPGNYFAVNGYSWNSIDFNDHDGWSIVGAEQVNYANQLVFENSVSGKFYIHNLDRYWNYVSGDWLTGASFYQAESDFGQDFDNDGVIGGNSYTTIESKGSVELQKDSAGLIYAKPANGSSDDITTSGQHVGVNTYAGWSPVAAETINGQNKVIWTHTNGTMAEWDVDSNWDWTKNNFHTAGSADFLKIETIFGMDFNNDGVVGSQGDLSSPTLEPLC